MGYHTSCAELIAEQSEMKCFAQKGNTTLGLGTMILQSRVQCPNHQVMQPRGDIFGDWVAVIWLIAAVTYAILGGIQ